MTSSSVEGKQVIFRATVGAGRRNRASGPAAKGYLRRRSPPRSDHGAARGFPVAPGRGWDDLAMAGVITASEPSCAARAWPTDIAADRGACLWRTGSCSSLCTTSPSPDRSTGGTAADLALTRSVRASPWRRPRPSSARSSVAWRRSSCPAPSPSANPRLSSPTWPRIRRGRTQHDVPFEETIHRARAILADHIAQQGAFEINCRAGILVCRR